MDIALWGITILLGLSPMLGDAAFRHPRSVILSASNASDSGAKSGENSDAGSSGNSHENSSNKSEGNSNANSPASSSSSSGVTIGVKAPRAKVTNPHGPISIPCADCHSSTSWKPIRSNPDFNHDLTGYPLRGMHQKVPCAQCHTSMVFKNVSSQCADCHADIHQRQFGANCANCHSVKGWQVSLQAIRNHQNRFPLVGAHALAQCEDCHKNAAAGQFVGLSTSCYSCHQQDFRTPVLDHAALGLPTTCESCHTMDSWFNAKFDHLKYTGYALTGMHATLACSACHLNNVFKNASAACYSCHNTDFDATNNPSHVKLSLPRDCSTCHSTTDWSNAKFDHALYAHYPLTGKHAAVACAQCHTSNNYNNTPTACVACHKADFDGTNNPPHVAGGFPTDCSLCHTTAGWTGATFNHNTTKFPLTGAHVSVACTTCHVNNNYTGSLPTNCYGCHQADFNKTNSPPHAAVGFPTTCAQCHNTTAWTGAPFDHSKTKFPLTGAHTKITCAQCHINNNYTTLPTDCVGCHQADFNKTNSPPHAAVGFPTTCATCHSTTDWTGATFDHNTTKFPLTGAHTKVTCAQCHINNNYLTVPLTCDGCHMADFNKTTNPNHVTSGFPNNCALCHTTVTWTASNFNHASVFPLTGAHATIACAACHTNNNFTSLPKDCYGCHKADYTKTNAPPHATAGFPTACATCHSTTDWTGASFNHNQTAFPLTGSHIKVSCTQCHVNNNYTSLPTACDGCHHKDFTGTTNPNHVTSGFPTDCTLCHNTTIWTTSTFNHSSVFPLVGAHATVACALCHVNNNYKTVPTTCYGCHQKDFNGTTNPNHVSASFPTTCDSCHGNTSWTPVTSFNHSTFAKWPLTGFHATLQCAQCHTSNNYGNLPTDCYSCHKADFTGTTNPNHVTANFPTGCQLCHNTTAWTGAVFDHSKTAFPLTGAHVSVACATCHVNNNYTTLPTNCYGCHQKDFTGTTNPNHVAASFPTDCQVCHTTSAWTGAVFDHSKTAFPLTGAHVSVACTTCHVNSNYTTLPTSCYGCHQKNFTGTTNPAHVAAGFPTDCTLCHNTTVWTTSTFNHSSVFPLVGAHATLTCTQCHTNNNYTTLPTTCIGCHQADFNGTTNPNHAAAGFPTTCDTCHSNTAWTPVTSFNHLLYANWALTGGHATVTCAQCHTNNNYGNLSTDCYSCHQADYNGTTNPNHAQAGFPTTCTVCHNTTSWTNATFNHNSTSFPLTGAHTTVACASCHLNTNYSGTLPTTCIGCHQTDFNGTTSPNHVQVGFPTTCATCHTTTAWTNATFNHNTTTFPLTGAHTTVACASCHVNNNYTTLPTTCYGCHQADFTGTTNPAHVAAGFPTDCTLCHNTTAFTTSTFNHSSVFPLVGAHATVACALCHINNNYTTLPTTCIGCHQADFNGTTNPNHAAAGFPTSCDTCHSTTAWTPASNFNHTTYANWALTGAHATVTCAQCHTNNNYGNLSTTCISCHQADYNGTTNPAHVAAGFPTDCTICHSTTNWTSSTFNHSTTSFPLTGAHTTVPCASCHVNSNYSGSLPTTCYGCHQADFTGTTNPAHVAAGFPTDCTLCHNTTAFTTSTFNHSSVFPLVGAHATLACAQCHTNNNYTTLPTTCIGCHQSDFNGTTNPNHATAGFPTTCNTCHTNTDWTVTGMTFNHALYANWALTGFHATMQCAQCHSSNNYGNLSTACITCHQADLQRHHQSGARRGGLPDRLHHLPLHHQLDLVHLQPQQHNIPADRLPCDHAVRPVPHQRQHLQRIVAHCLLRLPPGRLHRHHQSGTRLGRLPHHLRHLPYHDELERRHFQPQQYGFPADRGPYHRRLQSLPHQ